MKLIALSFCAAVALASHALAQDTPDYPPPATRENEVALFNRTDFSGLTFCLADNADPRQTWSVTNGIIHCTGTPTGYLRTAQVYSNYFLTVEWRFVKIMPQADKAGILVNIQPPDKVWPQCVQVQGKHDRQGDLFLMGGADATEHKGKDQNTPVAFRGQSREKPVGEWNTTEVICIRNQVEAYVNGYFINEISGCTVTSGYIGIQSAGAEIEIRSMFFSPLKY